MSLRKTVLVLLAVAATVTAHAQLAAYGTISVNRLSGLQGSPVAINPCQNGNTTGCSSYNDSVSPLGGTGGVYYDFMKLGPVKLGADLRGSIYTSNRGAFTDSRGSGTRIYSALGGVRAVFHTPFLPLRPYVQASVGLGRSDYGLSNRDSTGRVIIYNNLQYMGYAGLDIKLLPIMDVRIVELGYGGMNPMGANGHNYPVESVSSGLVFHLPF
jgi:hypothetical protein